MKRRHLYAYPEELAELVSQVNIACARSSELLELLKELTPGTENHHRLCSLMDVHHDTLMLFFKLSDELMEKVAELT